MARSTARLLCVSLFAIVIISSGLTDEPGLGEESSLADQDPQQEFQQRMLKAYDDRSKEFVIELGPDGRALKRHPKSVFHWINTARVGAPQTHEGSVYIWTDRGRAEVIGTMFSVKLDSRDTARLYDEFHSLSTASVVAAAGGAVVWEPAEPGITPKPFPGAIPVAKSKSARLAQMRRLARQFTGYSINRDDGRWELELIPQPLHRTGDSHPVVSDGAVFALKSTAGTDPEILLVIEVRQLDGQPKWHYSVCRFTDLRSTVLLNDEIVWELKAGGFSTAAGKNDIYRTLTGRSFNPLEE